MKRVLPRIAQTGCFLSLLTSKFKIIITIWTSETLASVLRASPKAGNRQRYHGEFSWTGSSNCASHLGVNYKAL